MSINPKNQLKAALEQINAEWKAFQTAHKILHKRPIEMPQAHGTSYGQGKLWSQSDHIADSQKLNDRDKLKG